MGTLRVLLVEDSNEDAELVISSMRDLDFEPVRVSNEADLRRVLREFEPHIVLSDHSMPGFSGPEALRIVQEVAPDVPFIFVSGTIGEEAAIDALRGGAVDYVLKDNLRRLTTAIENALRQVAEREERSRTEHALRDSEERFRAIVESTEDWVWEIDAAGRHTYSNQSVQRLLGYKPAELVGRNSLELLCDEDREAVELKLSQLARERRGWRHWHLRWRSRDGEIKLLDSTAQPLLDQNGELIGYRGVDRDVTLHFQQEAKIRQLVRMHAVLSALGNAILRLRELPALLDEACRLAVEQGQFTTAVVGIPTADHELVLANHYGDAGVIRMIAGLGPADLASPEAALRPSVRAFLSGHIVVNSDYAGSDLPVALRNAMSAAGVGAQIALPIGSPPWAVLGLCCEQPQEFDDEEIALLERMAAEIDYARDFIAKSERLEYLAYQNPSTGLPNHAAFQDRLQASLGAAPLLVGVMRIVHIGSVHDLRGRVFGDLLLAAVGRELARLLGVDGIVAHSAGDLLMFARPCDEGMPDCMIGIERLIHDCCAEPFVILDEHIHVALRCGLVRVPDHGDDFDTIERNALAALTEAGRRDVPLLAYSEELSERANRRLQLERQLRTALAEHQFELFLQPKFDSASRLLSGAEALLRWRHPVEGLISPAEFIPLLEQAGMIIPVGQWVMKTALAILRQWRERARGECRIAINVSARELRQQHFIDVCRELMKDAPPDHGLDIEVTESLLIDDIEQNIHVLETLRGLGCRVAIDDFGTGYSSLNYLSRLPVDVLKIDQSFIAEIATNSDTLALVTNIIGLAHTLKLSVVAEGVETEEQESLLRLLRCDELQGYLLGRPVPVAEFERSFLG